ncbi:MAG TPA: hypothetical protein VF163_17650 [Micromonosporaceae bacterium]
MNRVGHWHTGRWQATSRIDPNAPAADRRPADARTADARTADARTADARTADARTADARAADARAAGAVTGPVSRAQVMHQLIQRLADAAATVEQRPPHPVPRLDNNLALPDQFRVMVADLLAARPPEEVLRDAVGWIASTGQAL